jgi:serine/threonine-protein kinase RsbW
MNQARGHDQRFTPLGRARAVRPQATAFERSYLGVMEQVREVCADMTAITDGCALSDDLVLVTSELATNAIQHSRSGRPAGTFTVRVTLYRDDYAWVEVIDQGGEWASGHRRHGLTALASIAGDGNWGIDGDEACRVAWFRLDLPNPHPRRAATLE